MKAVSTHLRTNDAHWVKTSLHNIPLWERAGGTIVASATLTIVSIAPFGILKLARAGFSNTAILITTCEAHEEG